MKTNNDEIIGLSAVVLATVIWSSSFIAIKIALIEIQPMTLIFLRMLVASLAFLFFLKHFKGISFNKKDFFWLFIMGLFEPFLYFIFETNALRLTSASQAGVLTVIMPVMTAIIATIFLKEEVNKFLITGSALAFIGALWLSLSGSVSEYAPNPILGNFLEILAMFCSAGYAISVKYLSTRFSAVFLTAIQAFMGAILFFPLAMIEGLSLDSSFSFKSILSVVYLGLGVTMLGYGLFNFSLSKLPASRAAIFINLIPVFTVILAYLILNETLNSIQIVASILIFLGVFISQKK